MDAQIAISDGGWLAARSAHRHIAGPKRRLPRWSASRRPDAFTRVASVFTIDRRCFGATALIAQFKALRPSDRSTSRRTTTDRATRAGVASRSVACIEAADGCGRDLTRRRPGAVRAGYLARPSDQAAKRGQRPAKRRRRRDETQEREMSAVRLMSHRAIAGPCGRPPRAHRIACRHGPATAAGAPPVVPTRSGAAGPRPRSKAATTPSTARLR